MVLLPIPGCGCLLLRDFLVGSRVEVGVEKISVEATKFIVLVIRIFVLVLIILFEQFALRIPLQVISRVACRPSPCNKVSLPQTTIATPSPSGN